MNFIKVGSRHINMDLITSTRDDNTIVYLYAGDSDTIRVTDPHDMRAVRTWLDRNSANVVSEYHKINALIDAAQEVCDALGLAEWGTPERAEEILHDIIDFRWASLRAAINEAK